MGKQALMSFDKRPSQWGRLRIQRVYSGHEFPFRLMRLIRKICLRAKPIYFVCNNLVEWASVAPPEKMLNTAV
jgi:hypothetical protein